MREVMIVVMLLLGQVAFAQTGEEAPSAGVGLNDPLELEQFMDGAMTALLEAHHVAGGTVSVVKDGDVFFAKGYGFADAEKAVPVDSATSMFRIASISKLFVWTAVMQLWERGVLDLDDDVNRYLDFSLPANFPEPITLAHLLTHTAGFEDRAKGMFADGVEDLAPLGQVLASNVPARVLPPGEAVSYSNYGAGLAAYIVQRVSGLPFEEYVERFIYEPVGMSHSTFLQPVPTELEADLAVGHTWLAGVHEGQDFEYDPAVGDGAMSASAVDMARFMIAHLQGGRHGDGRIMEEATARRMHGRLFSSDPRIPGMAHGFCEVDANGRRGIGHGGDIGFFHSDLLLLPEENVGIFVSFNSDSGSKARSEIVTIFLDRYFPPPEARPVEPPRDFAERAARFTGWFRVNRYPHTTIEKIMLLAMGDVRITVTDDSQLSFALMGKRARFVGVEPLLFRKVGGDLTGLGKTVAFAENEAGEITRVYPGPIFALDRVAWYDTRRFQFALLAVGVLAFVIRLVRAVRNRKRSTDRTPIARWSQRLANTVSVLNLAFLVGFVAMLPRLMSTYLFPDGIYGLLVLPVIAALLTVGVVVLAVVGWTTADGSLKNRIYSTVFSLSAIGFVWFLTYWNLLGWHY